MSWIWEVLRLSIGKVSETHNSKVNLTEARKIHGQVTEKNSN